MQPSNIIKFAGAAVILLSALLFSIKLSCEYKAEQNAVSELYDMIIFIQDNIKHLMRPLPEIFLSYQNEYLYKNGLLPDIRNRGFKDAWSSQKILRETSAAFPIISDFVESIGEGYCSEELRLCDYTKERLEEIIKKNEKELRGKLKLYRTVPIMLALSVIFILI